MEKLAFKLYKILLAAHIVCPRWQTNVVSQLEEGACLLWPILTPQQRAVLMLDETVPAGQVPKWFLSEWECQHSIGLPARDI